MLMLGAMLDNALSITAAPHFAASLGCFGFIGLPFLDDSGRFDLLSGGPGNGIDPPFQ
jgi:hypothetical protein